MKVYQVEVGVLLNENDEKTELYNYNIVFDKKYGYYNENLWFCKTLEKAKESALKYVKSGVEKTYGIISEIDIDNEDVYISLNGNIIDKDSGYDLDSEFCDYSLDLVVKSYAKMEKGIVEDFIDLGGK